MSSFFSKINLQALADRAVSVARSEILSLAVRERKTGSTLYPLCLDPMIGDMNEIIWAGEKMILISFEPSSVKTGPTCMLAYFPLGRRGLMTEAYVGMSNMASFSGVPTPRIYDFVQDPNNPVGSDFILLEKAAGEPLDVIWPSLSNKQRKMVCGAIAEHLVDMFSYDSSVIYTHRMVPDEDKEGSNNVPLLLAPAFEQGPLVKMAPTPGKIDTEQYLTALAQRIDRIFNSPTSVIAGEVSKVGWAGKPTLTLDDIAKIRKTWYRLKQLIPYNTGGWYLPADLSAEARSLALAVLKCKNFGMYHSDLRMSRIIVNMKNGRPSLCIYGWEHAYCAPLWSCARMPTWLQPKMPQLTPLPITLEQQTKMSRHIYSTIRHLGTQGAKEWVVAYSCGEVERFVEGCLSAHWMWSDTIEVGLKWVKTRWEAAHPDKPFPIGLPQQPRVEDRSSPTGLPHKQHGEGVPTSDHDQGVESEDDDEEPKTVLFGFITLPMKALSNELGWFDMLQSFTKPRRLIKALPKRLNHGRQ